MIKKYNQYIKESLLDKLEGPREEEVESIIRKKYLDNDISIFDYYKKTKKLNIKGPSEEEVIKELNDKLLNNEIELNYYLIICVDNEWINMIDDILRSFEYPDDYVSLVLNDGVYTNSLTVVNYILSLGVSKKIVKKAYLRLSTLKEIKYVIKEYLKK